MFHHPVMGREAEGRLLAIRQGKQSVAEYSISFRILAAQSGYGDRALCGLFRRGLNISLKDELATRDDSGSLEDLIRLALVLDNRLRERERERGDVREDARSHPRRAGSRPASRESWRPSRPEQLSSTRTTDTDEVPMQLGGGRLGLEERWRRIREQACFYCGQQGHRVADFSVTPTRLGTRTDKCEFTTSTASPEPSRERSVWRLPKRLELDGTIYGPSRALPIRALVDSGADDCFIDPMLANELGCQVEELRDKKRVYDLDGRLLAEVKRITCPLKLKVSGNHIEYRKFYLMRSRSVPLILGLPWLQTHNPVISWERPAIENWSPFCYAHCLQSAADDIRPARNNPPEAICLDNVPSTYHDLRQVFSKERAQSLPPNRPYDCTIELINNTPLPSSRLYQVSHAEREALREYIDSSLAAGLIRPS